MCDSVTLNNIHSTYCSSLYGIELFNFSSSYMTDLYIAWRKVIRRIYILPNRTHNLIIIKLGRDIETRLDTRLAKRFKLFITSSVLAENYRYLLYKFLI